MKWMFTVLFMLNPIVLAQAPKADDAGAEKPKVYTDVRQILDQIPKDLYPPPGKAWDHERLNAFGEWTKKNIGGSELRTKARRRNHLESLVNGQVHDNLWVTTTPPPGSRISKIMIVGTFRQEYGEKLWATNPGVNINIRGKIRALTPQLDRKAPSPTTTILVSMEDCVIEERK